MTIVKPVRPGGATVGFVLLLAALAACKPREALVVFDVTVDPRALSYTEVRFSSDVPGARVPVVREPAPRERFRFGYYLPAAAGPVRIVAEARSGSSCVLGRGEITVTRLEAGTTTTGTDLAIGFAPMGRCEGDAGAGLPAESAGEAGPPPAETGGGDQQPPVVVAFAPADRAERVDRGAVIEVTFSEPIADGALAAAVKVTAGTTEVAGRITLEGGGKLLRFSPAAKLPMATTVTATVATVVRDLAGNQLAAPVSASFTTADGGWTEPVLIDQIDNLGIPGLPDTIALAVNRRGEAMVAWLRFSTEVRVGGVVTSVYANRFTPEAGWSKTGLAADNPAGEITGPRLALDDEGRALLVTDQRRSGTDAVGDGRVVMVSQFHPVKGWSFTPFSLNDRSAGEASGSNLAMAPNGDALATWSFNQATARVRTRCASCKAGGAPSPRGSTGRCR